MVKTLLISAMALTMAAVPGVALAKPNPGMRTMPPAAPGVVRHNWGPRRDGRWIGGWRAPGGWAAYRPAVRGYVLPRYWINPRFYVANWGRYGLYQPAPGYGWSRYYDDMVLTDAAGSIIDSRHNFDWDRYDRYDADGWDDWDNGGREYAGDYEDRDDRPAPPPPPRYKDKDGGLGGAAIGAVGGAALGAIVGGKGDRVDGAVIGGVAGAVAGGLIDKNDRYGRGPKKPSKADRRRWERERDWDARDGYDYDRDYGAGYDAPPVDHGDRRHWGHGERHVYRSEPNVYHHDGGSTHVFHHGGYGYGDGETVITIHSAPVVTTTTTTTEEYVYASAPRKRHVARKKVWKPRPKARCVC